MTNITADRAKTMKEPRTIFFAWQSWLPGNVTRNLIEAALEKAIKSLASEDETNTVVIDRATDGIPGAPQIPDTIREKIRSCAVFVGDITPVTSVEGPEEENAVPNPNVMIETGCAIESRGWKNMVLIANTAYGAVRDLPFDLEKRRILPYAAAPKADGETDEAFKARKHAVRERLAGALATALRSCLNVRGAQQYGVVDLCGLLFHGYADASNGDRWTIKLVAPIGAHKLDVLDLTTELERRKDRYVAMSRPGVARQLAEIPALRRDGDSLIATLTVLPPLPRESAHAIGKDLDVNTFGWTAGGVADVPRVIACVGPS